jgi:hypothetical protein
MKRISLYSIFLLACFIFFAPEARAQYVAGGTGIGADGFNITGYSATELDYYASAYYDAYIENYIYREDNPNPLAGAATWAYGYAEAATQITGEPGVQYWIIGDHYVVAYFTYSYYWYDPWGFSLYDEVRHGPSYTWYAIYAAYTAARFIYLGSTAVPAIYKNSAYRLIDEANAGGEFGFGYCAWGRSCVGVCAVGAFSSDKLYAGPCPKKIQCYTLYVYDTCVHDARVCNEIPQDQIGVCDP